MMTTGALSIKTRAGNYRRNTKYQTFIPRPLPPSPPVRIDDTMLLSLSKADQALGRLDAVADMLPNPNLFLSVYVSKEAVLSSQIEGTQASLTDVLEYEAVQSKRLRATDVGEVVNYVRAMNKGLERLETLPLSNRLLREIHQDLLAGTRGGDKLPGEFRTRQNWIGPEDSDPATAIYVPPPPDEMIRAMNDLETFIQDDSPIPAILKAGLIHSQFETIHPFLDGNGRMGRLLITFFLCHENVLKRPLLYLSLFFKQHRDEYYERLQRVRDDGAWESWLLFFIKAVHEVAVQAADTARSIVRLREDNRQRIQAAMPGSNFAFELLDHLFERPYVTVNAVRIALNVSYPTANNLIRDFEEIGVLEEITGQDRNRVFSYKPYLAMLS